MQFLQLTVQFPKLTVQFPETDRAIAETDCVIAETDRAVAETDCAFALTDCAVAETDCVFKKLTVQCTCFSERHQWFLVILFPPYVFTMTMCPSVFFLDMASLPFSHCRCCT